MRSDFSQAPFYSKNLRCIAGNGRTLLQPPQMRTVTQTAQATPDLSTLVAALTKVGLAGAVTSPSFSRNDCMSAKLKIST